MDLECIFEANDITEIERVKDLLETNNINVIVKNYHTQNLFGGYKVFAGYDPIVGSIQLYVNKKDSELSVNLIKTIITGYDIDENYEVEPQMELNDNKENAVNNGKVNRLIYFCFLLTMLTFMVFPYILNLFLLYKLSKKKKNIAIMLFSLSTLFLIISFIANLY